MKKYIQWALPLVLILGGAFMLAHSQGPQGKGMYGGGMYGGGMYGHGMFMGRMARQLNLTDAQKTQIKSLVQAQRPATEALRKQLAGTRKDMLTATANGSFDQNKVSQIAAQQAQIMAQLTVARQQLKSKIYNTVLTSEQKAQVEQMRQKELSRIDQWLQGGTSTPQQ